MCAEFEQVSISGYDDVGPSFDRAFQNTVIIRIGIDDPDSFRRADNRA